MKSPQLRPTALERTQFASGEEQKKKKKNPLFIAARRFISFYCRAFVIIGGCSARFTAADVERLFHFNARLRH